MSYEFCEHIETKMKQGIGVDTQGELLSEIERYFKNKGQALDYRKLCLVFMRGTFNSKIEQYYQDIRDGKRAPRFRDDVPTELIVELKNKGETLDSIAAITGLSRSTVVNRLKKWKQGGK